MARGVPGGVSAGWHQEIEEAFGPISNGFASALDGVGCFFGEGFGGGGDEAGGEVLIRRGDGTPDTHGGPRVAVAVAGEDPGACAGKPAQGGEGDAKLERGVDGHVFDAGDALDAEEALRLRDQPGEIEHAFAEGEAAVELLEGEVLELLVAGEGGELGLERKPFEFRADDPELPLGDGWSSGGGADRGFALEKAREAGQGGLVG
jgi:hypothetical protein